ncbi:MAG: VCBS repeat-containing protein, partial [Gammaproteobacteria bacterium]|nr:VCBS repeat-containing protein [Gammaproteobacteria bacterium]
RQSLLPEDMGSGLAWGDYDGDGDPDLFFVNFQGAIKAPLGNNAMTVGRSALYRNEGAGHFIDITEIAGLAQPSFGLGAAWGDYDNDGDLDLYITNYGPNTLYRNNGDGTFTDVAEAAGVGDDRFSAGCVWGDYDNDGHIDLYVTNYVQFATENNNTRATVRQSGTEIPYTINPSSYPPESNRLYHNNGDGSFSDVAEQAGVANPEGRSLSAAWFDFDNDGQNDLYVANDVSANGVFRNLGNGRFADIGAESLAADYRGA